MWIISGMIGFVVGAIYMTVVLMAKLNRPYEEVCDGNETKGTGTI